MSASVVDKVQGAMRLALRIARRTAAPGQGGPLIVGVSGGADSLCLLHALRVVAADTDLALHVAHLDHGLREDSAADATWVRDLCSSWELPCTVARCDVRALAAREGRSLEDAARQARYRFFGNVAAETGARAVAVGHTADDQAETVLLHLLRGAGLAGLAGMTLDAPWPLPAARVAGLRLLRPLLRVSRAETAAYCAAVGLHPRLDATNDDLAYTRNRLRHELLPLLRELNPGIAPALGRLAEAAAGDEAVLEALTREHWAAAASVVDGRARLERRAYERQLPGLQRRLLRQGVALLTVTQDLSWEHIEAARRIAALGQTGACAPLPHGLRLRVDYDALWIEPTSAEIPCDAWPALTAPLPLAIPGVVRLGDGWRLEAQLLDRAALSAGWDTVRDPWVAYLDADALLNAPVMLRVRRPGDWLQPLGQAGRQKVSDLLINAKIPTACRATLPLLVAGDHLVWALGVRVDQRFAVQGHTESVCVLRVTQTEERDDG